ncbi:MAG: branched-chain amino acid ABC transporter permease [Planctomycetes bacterium]|nr:branched-chain amino acid ABC transporter permease [Planctomycetota bacterium]
MTHVLEFVLAGVAVGALYALMAVGLNLVFGVMRFINVAHGDLLTLGAYASILWVAWMAPEPVGALLAAVAVGLVAGAAMERGLIARFAEAGRVNEQRALVLTLGLSMVLSNLMLAAFGAEYRSGLGVLRGVNVHLGDLTVEGQRLLALGGSVALSVLLMVFLRYTRLGLAMRATAQNPDAALASGIDVRRVHTIAVAVGTALAAASGSLIAPITYVSPTMGFPLAIKSFIVVIVGGLGNVWGAMIAGYLLGVGESLAVLGLPSGYDALIGPVLMVIVLVWRPSGLFGRKTDRA